MAMDPTLATDTEEESMLIPSRQESSPPRESSPPLDLQLSQGSRQESRLLDLASEATEGQDSEDPSSEEAMEDLWLVAPSLEGPSEDQLWEAHTEDQDSEDPSSEEAMEDLWLVAPSLEVQSEDSAALSSVALGSVVASVAPSEAMAEDSGMWTPSPPVGR